MMIKHISIKKKKGPSGSYKIEYHICDEKGKETALSSEQIGEVVGYKENLLLCKVNGKYKVYSLQGELMDTFQIYVNPYPLKVIIRIGRYEPTFYERAEDEEEEAVCIRLAEKYLRNKEFDLKTKQKYFNSMLGKGFDYSLILKMWEEITNDRD